MKILQVIDTLHVGGAEKVFVDVCAILYDKGVDVSALFLLQAGTLQDELPEGINTIALQRTNKWSVKKMYQCSQILRDYDIVHCHFRHVYKYMALVSKLFGVKSKLILHDHYGSIDIDTKTPFLMTSFFKPEYYIGVSRSLQQWAETHLKIDRKKVFLLENSIRECKQKLPYKKQYDLVLVSNFKPVKNNKFALDLIAENNASLLLVGQNQNNEYYNQIINQKVTLDLNCEIESSIKNVQPMLHHFKLGLHTSKSESGPLVLIEYLAQGLPFLAYETGEVSKILKPHFPEFFIDNFDVNQWNERIKILLSQNPNASKMQEIYQKFFGKEHYFNKLISIYQCLKN